MKLAVICPLGRSQAKILRENWIRQTFREAVLIVVENGAGVGACKREGLSPNVRIEARDRIPPGVAKNLGIEAARRHGADCWATFDDDDWYGEKYLEELVAAFEDGHAVVGKAAHFTKMSSGEVLFFAGDEQRVRANMEVKCVQGPTLASTFWEGMPMFDERSRGEDTVWCEAATRLGKPAWATSPFHWCYLRYGRSHGHAYPATDRQLVGFSRGEVYDVGAWGDSTKRLMSSGDLERVNAVCQRREKPDLDLNEYMALGPAAIPV